MELKTLKDFEDLVYRFKDDTVVVSKRLLRQEAIKRIKNCKTCNKWAVEAHCRACERDMWFNNLTEEDLK